MTRLWVCRRARAWGEDCDGIVRGVTVGGTHEGDLKRPSGQAVIIAEMNKYTLEPFKTLISLNYAQCYKHSSLCQYALIGTIHGHFADEHVRALGILGRELIGLRRLIECSKNASHPFKRTSQGFSPTGSRNPRPPDALAFCLRYSA
jgi:hypothetical protein